jgi:hypothetical protein
MTTPNERRIRAGYDLFLAADPTNPDDWTLDAPVAALMDEDIHWYDDEDTENGLSETGLTDKRQVLERLRQLRDEMPCCQIISLFEVGDVVHTVDHAVKKDPNSYDETRPHLCASSFKFNSAGKVVRVRYCSKSLALNLPAQPGSPAPGASS